MMMTGAVGYTTGPWFRMLFRYWLTIVTVFSALYWGAFGGFWLYANHQTQQIIKQHFPK
jgi:hypothetical protein